MADRTDSPTCPICFEAYTATAHPHDRRPIIVCKNGHTLCSTCANDIDTCPTCREPKMVVLNRALLDIVERQNLTVNHTGVPEISADHVKLAAQPFADGAYADVYDATWQKQSVALKVLRRHVVAACELQDLLKQACLAMSLNHPNVVRVFGVVSINGGKGLLMEKAGRGSLRAALESTEKLSLSQQVSVSIDIIDGLDYIHSKQMVHRDLKPENVLLFDVKSQLTAKIADFGTSKVVHTSLAGTAAVGTPYYMAPELFETEVRYGSQVDVFSVAIVLYEVFSGRNVRDAYGRVENTIQLAMCVASGQRPEMPKSFPVELRTVVERGWSADANGRPTLADFREALCRLKATTRNADPTASASASRSGEFDVDAAFEAQLHKLEQAAKAYKLVYARSQVEACRRLWMRLDDRTKASASTARFHSVKGYVHHWFGECSDAYADTYQALAQLHELCLLGTSVEGEQVVTILRYAVQVCWSQDQLSAALVLVTYAVRYARSKLSAAAYADAFECFGYFPFCCDNLVKILEFVLSTRRKAAANKPEINVAVAHYYLADKNYKNGFAAMNRLHDACRMINEVDSGNIWAAVRFSLYGQIIFNKGFLQQSKQNLEYALGLAERILGRNNQTVSLIYLRLGFTFKEMKRFGEAEQMFKAALETAENSLGPNCWFVAWTLKWLADLYANQLNRCEEAEELFLRSIDIYKSVLGPGNARLFYLYNRLDQICTKLGQTEKAATYSRLASEVTSGKLENKLKSIEESLNALMGEMLKTLGIIKRMSEAPGELVDTLHQFFKVAPKPQPL